MSKRFIAFLLLAAGAINYGCSPPPGPRRTLTGEDKTADLYWLYSQFNENYAPLEYKAQRYGFDYNALKQKYLTDAQATTTNEEFYKLMFQFVSEFKDAHTSASLANASLPARTKVAYLGFSGKRLGANLSVTELLPTIRQNSAYPIRVGDVITKLDGVSLKDAILADMVKWRNLGQEESNLTYHMNRLFNRESTSNTIPTAENTVVTVLRNSHETEITLPWIVKDLYVFSREQRAAAPTQTTTQPSVGSSRVDLQACKLEYSIVSPK